MNNKVLLVVMDGIGISQTNIGNMVASAHTPTLDWLFQNCSNVKLKAHGTSVGLPSDEDMGNSEVGHNALGCGQIYSQGAKLVNESMDRGEIFASDTWMEIVSNCNQHVSTLHFIGLLSDGNVHSNILHLITMLKEAKKSKVNKVRIHILLDGRDVPATSALTYVSQLEEVLKNLNDPDFDAKIASGGGRMKITMDRYQAVWDMVKLGWDVHVKGIGRQFSTAAEAVLQYRSEKDVIDQDLEPFVISENGKPIGRIVDHDSVILYNFRGDRAIELSMAFENDEFEYFDRGQRPNVTFAGMLQYDGDLKIPKKFLIQPPDIKNTLSELLVTNRINQYAVSETQKYGHVTYFWNGNKSKKFNEALETFFEIPSDKVSFDERPWMKAAEITDQIIHAVQLEKYDFIRCNYPNGDMVGHTGNLDAVRIAVETVDLCLARILKVCRKYNITLLITADHGNADEMLEKNKQGKFEVKTAHSLNLVPFIIYDHSKTYNFKDGTYGLANVAPSIAQIFGLAIPSSWEESLIY